MVGGMRSDGLKWFTMDTQQNLYSKTNGDTINHLGVNRNLQSDASPVLSPRDHSPSSTKNSCISEERTSSDSIPPLLPNYHASALGPWSAVVSYDACVRLCLNAWARGCEESALFLNNECAILRDSFSLRHVLLQSEDELLSKNSSELISGASVSKPKKMIGRIKVRVHKVKMGLDAPSGCVFPQMPKLELQAVQTHITNAKSKLSSGWEALRKVQVTRHTPNNGSLVSKSLTYVHASAQYTKEIAGLLKNGLSSSKNTSSSTSHEGVQVFQTILLMT